MFSYTQLTPSRDFGARPCVRSKKSPFNGTYNNLLGSGRGVGDAAQILDGTSPGTDAH